MVALIGPSGSGKSTLVRALTGLSPIDPGAGRIEVLGQTVQADGRVADRVRAVCRRVGFIFQQFNLVGRLSLFTNVALGSLGRISSVQGLLGYWPAETKQAVMAALFTGDRIVAGEPDTQGSGGHLVGGDGAVRDDES